MRTKALLGLAALAVSAVSVTAQNVYSLNVVGYVNKSFQAYYYTLVCNPFMNGANNLGTIIPTPPDNTTAYRWNIVAQDLDATVPTYSAAQQKWIPDATFNPGEGFFISAGANFTNTFVGEVKQTDTTIAIAGSYSYQAIASPPPISGNLATILTGYTPSDNDTVYTWNIAAQDFDAAVPTYSAAQSKWIPDATINPGDGFFLSRAGGQVNWVRSFTVPQ
jgi:hypothetical protein